MPRRYRRRRYAITRPVKTTKYSNETYSLFITAEAAIGSKFANIFAVTPDSSVLGTRKVKNFTVKFNVVQTVIDNQVAPSCLAWALIYVPENVNPAAPYLNFGNPTAVSLFEPNQNVIMSGMADSNAVYTNKTRLARNLNAGDKIAIIIVDLQSSTETSSKTLFLLTVNYAISF